MKAEQNRAFKTQSYSLVIYFLRFVNNNPASTKYQEMSNFVPCLIQLSHKTVSLF